MSGYDLVNPRSNKVLSQEKLKLIVKVLERIAAGATLTALQREKMPGSYALPKIAAQFPDVAKAWAVAKEMSASAFEDRALDEAERLLTDKDLTGVGVKATQVAMEQWKWTASRRDPKQYGGQALGGLIVPIQINTSLDIGQGGVTSSQTEDTYAFHARISASNAEKEEQSFEDIVDIDPEPVVGSGKFGITAPPERALKARPAPRLPKGHKDLRATRATAAKYAIRKPHGTAQSVSGPSQPAGAVAKRRVEPD